MSKSVIELKVRNHPGVMSHITGLFARRAFNLEGILCGPINGGATSRIYLLVKQDNRLVQVLKNLEKLYDVIDVALKSDYDHSLFERFHEYLQCQRSEGQIASPAR